MELYFKSTKGISGFNKETIFLIKDIPQYGNVKVYYKDGILERFFWMYQSELQNKIENKEFINTNN